MMVKTYIFSKIFARFALRLAAANVNQTCMYWLHQDEIPQSAQKLRKF